MKRKLVLQICVALSCGVNAVAQDSRPSSDSRPTSTTTTVVVHADGTFTESERDAVFVGSGELVQNCADQAAAKAQSSGLSCVGVASDIKSSPKKSGSGFSTDGSANCKITCTGSKPGLADPLLEEFHN